MTAAAATSTGRTVLSSFWFWMGAILVLRIVALVVSPANLGPDEAQYWYWSRDLAFGYFSKPPLIAWAIAATTAVFGNAEWAIRLSAPLFHSGAAAFLYRAAARAFDRRIGFWVGLGWLTLPGIALSSFLIATDAPLLFFWSGALFFLMRIVETRRASAADFAGLGAMVGFGLLSKYAMIYFPIAAALAAALIPEARRALARPTALLAALLALAIAAPNIHWNSVHDFSTLSHTAANANWGASLFNLAPLFSFLAGQAAVFGPVLLIAFIIAIASGLRGGARADPLRRTLIIFALAPLVVVTGQAFISRAHANWAASAYPAALILTTAFLAETGRSRWLAASLALHAAAMVAFIVAMSNFALIDGLGLARATREIRGWERHAADVARASAGYDHVAVDDRALTGALLYYRRKDPLPISALSPNPTVDHHYEAFLPFDWATEGPVLFVTTRSDPAHVDYRFRRVAPKGESVVEFGGVRRTYGLYEIEDYFVPPPRNRPAND